MGESERGGGGGARATETGRRRSRETRALVPLWRSRQVVRLRATGALVGRGEEPRRVQFAKGRRVPLVSPTAPPSKSQNPPFWPLGGSVAAGVLPACVERTVVSWFGAVLRSSVPPKFQQGPALTLASPAWKGAAGFSRQTPARFSLSTMFALCSRNSCCSTLGDAGIQQTIWGLGLLRPGSGAAAPLPHSGPRLGGFRIDSLPAPFPCRSHLAFAFLLPFISRP